MANAPTNQFIRPSLYSIQADFNIDCGEFLIVFGDIYHVAIACTINVWVLQSADLKGDHPLNAGCKWA
jgi:hypothetical protein